MLQQGKMLFCCPCEAGVFDVAPPYPTRSAFAASDHASVSTDSSLSDEPLRDNRVLQQPIVPQVHRGAPAIRETFYSEG